MRVNVHLFAAARQRAGAVQWSVEIPEGSSAGGLKSALSRECPPLEPLLAVSRIAVNGEYATDDQLIGRADELAVIPPVSGGSSEIEERSW